MENESRSNCFKFQYFVAHVKLIKNPHGHKPSNALVFAPESSEGLYISYEKVQKSQNKSLLQHTLIRLSMCICKCTFMILVFFGPFSELPEMNDVDVTGVSFPWGAFRERSKETHENQAPQRNETSRSRRSFRVILRTSEKQIINVHLQMHNDTCTNVIKRFILIFLYFSYFYIFILFISLYFYIKDLPKILKQKLRHLEICARENF